jgi:hypothetical protein
MVPVIVAVGGWMLQSTIERGKEVEARALTDARRDADKDKIALEYVKLAKEILTFQKNTPDVLVKWSWQLINAEAPRPFDPEDFERVVSSSIKIPVASSVVGHSGAEEQISSSPLAGRASTEALNLLIIAEVGSKADYDRSRTHPLATVGGGVIIGLDYDLAHVTQEAFRDTWTGHLSPEVITELLPAVGVTDETTTGDLVAKLSNVTISWDQAVGVFLSKTLPHVDAQLRLNLPNVDLLPPESYGALLDLVYNRGPAFTIAGDRYAEMREIREQMENRQFLKIPSTIRTMKRLYSGAPGLARRRELEAALFEKGFAGSSSSDVTRVAVPAGFEQGKKD